jgi:SulP family sulfate permease
MSTRALISNAMAGGLIGVINITVAISIAALMFAGTKPEYFATGVLILLVGTVVSGLGGTLASGFSGVIVAPRSGLAPVFAGLVGGVVATVPAGGEQGAILPTMIMAVMITAFLTGTVLLVLGQLRLGRLVRYIPYPVMGGFFAGIGFVFVQGGLSVASGESVSIGKLDELLTADALLRTLPAIIFGIALYWVQRRWGHWTTFPLFLFLGFGAFYVALYTSDWTHADAIANGWLPLVPAAEIGLPLVDLSAIAVVDWPAVAAQSASIATVALLSAIMLLLDSSGIEIITERELDPNKELKIVGITNMLNGLVGGYPGVHAATDTAFTYKLGGAQRLTGFVYAAVIVLAITAGMGFVATIPTFILGGLLLYIGIDFLVSWTWDTRRGLPLHDYVVILLILAVIAAVGILAGVGFGLVVMVVLFVFTYSRLTMIKSEMDESEHGSHVDRDPACCRLLNREGHQIWIMRLQGFIFFGSADQFAERIKDRISNQSEGTQIRYLVLDFRHVSRLDTSAVQVFRGPRKMPSMAFFSTEKRKTRFSLPFIFNHLP